MSRRDKISLALSLPLTLALAGLPPPGGSRPSRTRRDKISLALSLPLTLALAGLLAAALARPVPSAPISDAPTRFEANRALSAARRLAVDYPHRVVGSETSRRAQGWLIRQFMNLDLPVE